ncbi:hypothetical protein BURCENBC7_AP4126 [Burkholderia cenocepacia BC7]|nr:hypothetical protein BURCENBC7_AP4126 [Burkholderia cenocepacia BC7]
MPAVRERRRIKQKKIIRFCSGRSLRARRRAPRRLRSVHPTPTEPVMPHSCPQRAAFIARSPSTVRPSSGPDVRNTRTAIAAWCLRVVGWYRLERLLASIPDSNDDFGLA